MPPISRTIFLKAGDQRIFRLPGGAMAGYQWRSRCGNRTLLSVRKTLKSTTKNGPLLSGKSAMEIFTVTALAKGKTTLRFKQLRPWETPSRPVAEKYYAIIIT